ncbi:flippase [Methylomonas montana]|uniref:flippase n=1 Tax=Methylomonas montana TaxID=3058963 RepID=UPI00265AC15B|nr:flippase [Methylomonas montana]WKJ88633.1 flippase [Methylomonas montana]
MAQHQGFKRYFKNTLWMMIEQVLRIIAGLLVGIWVARYLGPEQFGLFSYILAFTSIFSGMARLGLDGIMVRELVNQRDQRDIYLGTAFWLELIGAFIVIAIIIIIVPFTSNDATTNFFIFIITAGLVFQSFEVVEYYFQSQVLAKVVSICKVIQLTLSSLIKVYLVMTNAELFLFVLVTLFDSLTLATCYFIAYSFHEKPSFFKCFDITIVKKLIKDSWPLTLSSIVVMIYMRINQIMIKDMLGEYEVGIYSAAVRLSEAWYFIPVMITSSIFPAILNAKKSNEELYNQYLQRLYTFMVWLAIGIAIPMTFLSDWLIAFLYGEAYKDAGPIFMILIWVGVFVNLGVASSKWVITENLVKNALFRTSSGAIVSILLNYFLIENAGVYGAAYATFVSYFYVNFFSLCLFRKTRVCFFQQCKAFNIFSIRI